MFACVATDPGTMMSKEAMREADCAEFIKAMHKELDDHVSRKHWKVVLLKGVPDSKKYLRMVWSTKRKRNPLGEVINWKSRLCTGGHRSVEFVDY